MFSQKVAEYIERATAEDLRQPDMVLIGQLMEEINRDANK